MVTLFLYTAPALLATAALTIPGCRRPSPPVAISHVVNLSMSGLTLGEERVETIVEGQRETSTIRTTFSRPPGVRLESRLTIERGRPVALRVSGEAPAFLPSAVDVAVTGDRSDTFPVRSPLPLHVLAALTRRSIVAARREFTALPEGMVSVADCGPATLPYADATCHELTGITWGAVHVFLDRRQMLAAAVVPTAWGLLLASTPDRDDSHPALLEHYARSRGTRLTEAAPPITSAHRQPIVFANVRIVDPAGAPVENGRVVINGDLIAAAGPADEVDAPSPSRIIDGRGLSVVPGLWDMHAHLKQPEWGPAYLASGVTSVRDLGSDEPHALALRQLAPRGPFPRAYLAAFVDGPSDSPYTVVQANTPEQGRHLVRRFRQEGYDEIKVWNNVPAGVLPHLASEAHRLGMRITGHVPSGLSAFDAIDAGLDGISHIGALLEAAGGSASSRDGRRLVSLLRERNVVVDPTLVVTEYANRSTAVPLSAIEPGFDKAPRPVQLAWSAFGQPPERASEEPLRRAMALARDLHAAGVRIVAGTDQGVPGHTLHRELELYVRAGLTPMQALATATIVPAEATRASTAGRVAAGRHADLVLVEGSPDRTIADIRRVRYVVKDGRVYEPAALWNAVGFRP